MLQKEQLKPTVIHAIAIMNSEIQVINALEVSYLQLFGIYLGTMRVIVYIYIVSIVLLLLYTGVVYFLTEKYQPRETEDSSKSSKYESYFVNCIFQHLSSFSEYAAFSRSSAKLWTA